MRKLPLLLSIFAFLYFPKIILAASSSASVHVDGTHTSITVESNGEVKTYDSNNPGSVSVQSSDGSARAYVNSQTDTNSNNYSTDNIPKASPKPSLGATRGTIPTPTNSPTPADTSITNTPQPSPTSRPISLIDRIKNFIKRLLAKL